jgi:hypothetical protein
MKRLLMVCALAGFAIACGDDEGDGDGRTDAGSDSGLRVDSGTDSGTTDAGPVAVKVTNVGAACTVPTVATACGGASPSCGTATWAGVAYPEGHCEAACTKSAECGSTGLCPLGEGLANSIIGATVSMNLMTSTGVCYKKCTTTGDCRTGYKCNSMVEVLGGSSAQAVSFVPSFAEKVCVPNAGLVRTAGDGGVGDGGTALRPDGGVDGGLDGG